MINTDFILKDASRPCAVAGSFYTNNSIELQAQIDHFLALGTEDYQNKEADNKLFPKAIIAPHAGYYYSGKTAGKVYARLIPWREKIKRIVLIGPSHRTWFDGLGLPSVKYLNTPLNDIEVDSAAYQQIAHLSQVQINDDSHQHEHSLEVQLPFIQTVLPGVPVLPFTFGEINPEEVADVFEQFWIEPSTIFVVSTDLSHFLQYEECVNIDQQTINKILNFQANLGGNEACGCTGVNAILIAALRHNLQPQLIEYINSGDVTGDHSRVVGYSAFCFREAFCSNNYMH